MSKITKMIYIGIISIFLLVACSHREQRIEVKSALFDAPLENITGLVTNQSSTLLDETQAIAQAQIYMQQSTVLSTFSSPKLMKAYQVKYADVKALVEDKTWDLPEEEGREKALAALQVWLVLFEGQWQGPFASSSELCDGMGYAVLKADDGSLVKLGCYERRM